MWLKLNLEDINFHFQINKYRKSTRENWDCEWCRVDLTLQSRDWLNYQIHDAETMLATEVEELRDGIDALLRDGLEEPKEITCIEPDFEFQLHPKADVRNNPDVIYVKPGHEIIDIDMDLVLSFWDDDGALTANRMILAFDREDLEKLLCYLRLITGLVDENDEQVQSLIADGSLYGNI